MVNSKPRKSAQKIEIKRIENKKARQVCFSKRRSTIFKKASELSIHCGAMIVIVFFSPGGKVFSFGHPSVSSVVSRFLTNHAPNHPIMSNTSQGEEGTPTNIRKLLRRQLKLRRRLEAMMHRKKLLKEEIARMSGGRVMNQLLSGCEEMVLEDLEEFHKELKELHAMINERIGQMSQDDGMQVHMASMP